jgi:hypothetical protein
MTSNQDGSRVDTIVHRVGSEVVVAGYGEPQEAGDAVQNVRNAE